jgi:uncharacterized membrane protein YgdD (TMEM256/DUF423 family)
MVSPLSWLHDLILLFPLFLFSALNAPRMLEIWRSRTGADLIAAGALFAVSIASELIGTVPNPNPQLILAMLVFAGSLLILRARIAARV